MIKVVESGRVVLSNADYMHVTPYLDGGDTIGNVTYDIVSIVGDTLSFTPDDNEVNEIAWEFGDTPLIENITLGKIQFAATCIDFQNDILKTMMGYEEGGSGTLYAPNAYKDVYAVMEIGFKNTDVKVVVPKLKINSKAVIGTMKTGTSEGQLAGTCYNASMKAGDDTEKETPMAILGEKVANYTVGNASFTVKEGVNGSAVAKISLISVDATSASLSASVTGGTASSYEWSDGETTTTTLTLDGLKANTNYVYSVKITLSDGTIVGDTISFTTLNA